jgi:hypothetical protein
MKSASYSMKRRTHEARIEENVENMETRSSSYEKPIHLQNWVNKNKQTEKKGIHEVRSSLTFSKAYMGSCGRIHIHTRANLNKVRVHMRDVYGTVHVPMVKALEKKAM